MDITDGSRVDSQGIYEVSNLKDCVDFRSSICIKNSFNLTIATQNNVQPIDYFFCINKDVLA